MGPSPVDLTFSDLDRAFRAHRELLFGLSYRLTGSVEDAEEIVQETFTRVIERPPPRTDKPWRPWLVRVAVNLSLDALRRRKRRRYPGPWLPVPLSESEALEPLQRCVAEPAEGPEAQYSLRESATFAFLAALEALSPRQRAVLVLAEVFEYSAREVGELLGVSEGAVRVALHRARRAMQSYEARRTRSLDELEVATRRVLDQLLAALLEQDAGALVGLLAEDVCLKTDSGGQTTALSRPTSGAARVARLFLQVARRRLPGSAARIRSVGGLPALWIEFGRTERRQAPRALVCCELDARGAISELNVVFNPDKLARLHAT